MKKILLFLLVAALLLPFYGCEATETPASTPAAEKEYTIQYADDAGQHTITVKSGDAYSINVPTRKGYDFVGLFDAEEEGVKYVTANGSSVSTFTDNKNLILFPRYQAKEYTLVLNYQGAPVTGSRSMTVSYGSLITSLPLDLKMDNKTFTGWYTQPDKQGTQVCDEYGVIPSKNIVNDTLFDFSDPNGYIHLYAGFKGQEFTLTLYHTGVPVPDEVQVEYGTYISRVQTETRINGKAAVAWSKTKGADAQENIFSGKVTGDMVLYALEYAPVIDFESNGGSSVEPIVCRQGETITLPVPKRENYIFGGWADKSGNQFLADSMPSESLKLFAVWQACIVFDTNGGTPVEPVSQTPGTQISLPQTEKAGYMFAGWYQANGEPFTAVAMPEDSLKLYAKYYKTLTTKIVVVDATNIAYATGYGSKPDLGSSSRYKEVDISGLYNIGVRNMKVTVHYQSRHAYADANNRYKTFLNFYHAKTASDAYLVMSFSEEHLDTNYKSYSYTTQAQLLSETLYASWYQSYSRGYDATHANWSDIYLEIEYPDMSKLY